jgi:hypothetical protein
MKVRETRSVGARRSLGNYQFAASKIVLNSFAQVFVLVTLGYGLSDAKSARQFLYHLLHLRPAVCRSSQSTTGIERIKLNDI